MNLFETSLPLRLDYEAMLAYLLLPPAGGVFLLVMEHKSDYVRYVMLEEIGFFDTSAWSLSQRSLVFAQPVMQSDPSVHPLPSPLTFYMHRLIGHSSRFHAWQSSLLFASIFVS